MPLDDQGPDSPTRRPVHPLQPDILAALFLPSELFQLDQVQLRCLAAPFSGRLRLLVLAQNTRDTAGWLNLRLGVNSGKEALVGRLPPLRIEIGPAAILMARLDIPLRAGAGSVALCLRVKGSAVIRGGHTVRPQRRTPVHRRVRPPFVPPLRVWPRRPSLRHWVLGHRPVIRLTLSPAAPAEAINPLSHPVGWQVGEFWLPGETEAIDELHARVKAAMYPAQWIEPALPATTQPAPVLPDEYGASVRDESARA